MDRIGIPSGLNGVSTALLSLTSVGLIDWTDWISENAGDMAALRDRADAGDGCLARCAAIRRCVEGETAVSAVMA
jgi:hypothetical protein